MGTPIVISCSAVFAAVVIVAVVIFFRKRSRPAPASSTSAEGAGLAAGSPASAQPELERRVNTSPLRALSAVDREAYAMEWAALKRRFVDDPATAITAAGRLVNRAMFDRGFPMSIFEQKAPEIAFHYPAIVQNYQAGHAIVTRRTEGRIVSNAELNQAMLHFDALFQELLEPAKVEAINHRRRRSASGERAS